MLRIKTYGLPKFPIFCLFLSRAFRPREAVNVGGVSMEARLTHLCNLTSSPRKSEIA